MITSLDTGKRVRFMFRMKFYISSQIKSILTAPTRLQGRLRHGICRLKLNHTPERILNSAVIVKIGDPLQHDVSAHRSFRIYRAACDRYSSVFLYPKSIISDARSYSNDRHAFRAISITMSGG